MLARIREFARGISTADKSPGRDGVCVGEKEEAIAMAGWKAWVLILTNAEARIAVVSQEAGRPVEILKL